MHALSVMRWPLPVSAPQTSGINSIADEADFDAERWYHTLQDERVSLWYRARNTIRMMMKDGVDLINKYDLRRFRFLGSVGEPLNPEAAGDETRSAYRSTTIVSWRLVPDRRSGHRRRPDRTQGGGRGRCNRQTGPGRNGSCQSLRITQGQLRAERRPTSRAVGFARTHLGAVVIPREITFLSTLPKTRSGKIMRRLLKAGESGLPEDETSKLEAGS